jgi:hypothetical protein
MATQNTADKNKTAGNDPAPPAGAGATASTADSTTKKPSTKKAPSKTSSKKTSSKTAKSTSAKTSAKTRPNGIADSSMTSAVTTDIGELPPEDHEGKDAAFAEQSFAERNSIGLVQVEGIDFRYVGQAPAREIQEGGKPTTPSGVPIGVENSRFTALADVPFGPSIRVKDMKSGEFYYPGDTAKSWDDVNLNGSYLIER